MSFDGAPQRRQAICKSCEQEYPFITAFVRVEQESSSAIVYAACHGHEPEPEAWLDVVLGPFSGPDFADNVTFSCRVRSTGATLVEGPVAAEGRVHYFGCMLSPEQARSHPSGGQAWEIVTFVATNEPTLRAWIGS